MQWKGNSLPLGNERGLAVLYQTSTRGGCFSRAAYALQIPSNLNWFLLVILGDNTLNFFSLSSEYPAYNIRSHFDPCPSQPLTLPNEGSRADDFYKHFLWCSPCQHIGFWAGKGCHHSGTVWTPPHLRWFEESYVGAHKYKGSYKHQQRKKHQYSPRAKWAHLSAHKKVNRVSF